MPRQRVLVDSNVLLDVFLEDGQWYKWSSVQLQSLAQQHLLVINPVIYAEVSVGFEKIEELEAALPVFFYTREQVPWEAAFLAGKCFLRYRRKGGARTAPLPDFFIGAHALVRGMSLLTRDASRYRTYFPGLDLIAP